MLLPSPPPLLFAFAPVFVTGWVFASAPFIPILLSASSSVGVIFLFSFSSTVLLAENIIRDCDRHRPRIARIAGEDQESHPGF